MSQENGLRLTTLILLGLLSFTTAADQIFGTEPDGGISLRIAELLADPDRYVDQTIQIEGLVDDVCPRKGCWVDIMEAQSREVIRFKVEDDVIVFPATAVGSQILAQGVLRRYMLNQEQTAARLRHLAEEKNEPFDESTVTGPTVFYQVEGTGAVLEES